MKIIVMCLIVLAALFIGHSVYDRTMADRKLSQAVGMLPNSPLESYKTMKEVLGYNRLVALGKIGEVQKVYLDTLEKKIVGALGQSPAPAEIYPAVEQAMLVLEQVNKQTMAQVRDHRVAIMKAAQASVPALKEKGSLRAWDNMVTMFQNLGNSPSLTAESFDNFTKWFDEVKAVERRPIGLRDAVKGASEAMGQALGQIQLRAAGPGEQVVVTAPPNLADDRLIEAEKALDAAQRCIDSPESGFTALFGEKEVPPELCGLWAKIKYNRAALKLAHFQDRRTTIFQTGSDYMAEFLVRSDTSTVPSASEMVAAWEQGARNDFQEAQRSFARAETMDEPMRRAYAALAIWSEGELGAVVAGGNPGEYRMRAMQMARGLNGKAALVVQMAQNNPRATVIVEVP